MSAHGSRHFLAQGERAVRFRPGTALLYRMDVWHRGTPVLEGATRYTHHIGIRHADAMCAAAANVVGRFLLTLVWRQARAV